MRVAIPQNKTHLITDGLAATLVSIPGIEATMWVPTHKPVFDMLEEIKPEWIICPSNMLTPIFIDAIKEYNVNLILLGLCEQDTPNVRLVCVDENTPDKIVENSKQDIPCYKIKPAANIAQYNDCNYDDKYKSDILYFSNVDISKKPHIYYSLSELISLEKYQIKICGTTKIPLAEYIGVPTLQQSRALLGSTKIALDFDRNIIYDCASSKTFCLSNIKQDMFPSYQDNLVKQVEHFLSDKAGEKHRKSFTEKAYKNTIENNTFFHRIHDMLNLVDESTLAQRALHTLNNIIDKNSKDKDK